MFNTCVITVMLYGSEACGYNTFSQYDQIQYRAMRFYWADAITIALEVYYKKELTVLHI